MGRLFTETARAAYMPPLLISLAGPPGGGKTKSALRMGDGMAKVRPGSVVLIDTEGGRALKYKRGPHNPNGHDFVHVQFLPPFKPEDFLEAIRQQLALNPACIIIDSGSDEHVGEGGYLDWHDQEVPKSGGNEWAAWNKPSRSRQRLINGLQQITVPLIWTFRAKEKTTQVGRKVEKIGLQPVAPMELVHTMDLACIIPARANGVPLWSSDKVGEDFVIKLPEFLSRYIERGATLNEDLGEALALWQAGKVDASGNVIRPGATGTGKRSPEEQTDAYVAGINATADLEELRNYQMLPQRVEWVGKLKTLRPDLYDRIVEAQSQKFAALQAAEPGGNDDDDQFPNEDD